MGSAGRLCVIESEPGLDAECRLGDWADQPLGHMFPEPELINSVSRVRREGRRVKMDKTAAGGAPLRCRCCKRGSWEMTEMRMVGGTPAQRCVVSSQLEDMREAIAHIRRGPAASGFSLILGLPILAKPSAVLPYTRY